MDLNTDHLLALRMVHLPALHMVPHLVTIKLARNVQEKNKMGLKEEEVSIAAVNLYSKFLFDE